MLINVIFNVFICEQILITQDDKFNLENGLIENPNYFQRSPNGILRPLPFFVSFRPCVSFFLDMG